jgi:PhoPQ-activated pathogenicity-related protein
MMLNLGLKSLKLIDVMSMPLMKICPLPNGCSLNEYMKKKSYSQISMVVMFQSTKTYMFWYVLPRGCEIHFLFFHILLVVAYTLHQFVT